VFAYINKKYSSVIAKLLGEDDKKFKKLKKDDDDLKERHLRLFRPNLENPANKSLTLELN
jgi:DNA-binding HxlR family transcriptional regulator